MSVNKVIHQCPQCSKNYKSIASLKKHTVKCVIENPSVKHTVSEKKTDTTTLDDGPKPQENNYDINMTFLEGNKVQVEMKKQNNDKNSDDDDEEDDYKDEDGAQVLKDILRPKVSQTYQDEIDKLDNLIKMFKNLPISDDPNRKDHTIEQLKTTITILMTQSQSLIKEMKQMSRRNSYYRNNIMLAAFMLDKCRKDVPETEEDFENMFS